jgi:hypothetical protein
MMTNWLRAISRPETLILLALLGLGRPVVAQQVSFALLQPGATPPAPIQSSVQPVTLPEAPSHRFWDRKNSLLFVSSAAFSTADFFLTRSNLNHGGQELNPVTRVFSGSTAGLAVNFAGETAGVIGLSYVFHKTGHHRIERVISMLNIGASAAAVSFDLAHR